MKRNYIGSIAGLMAATAMLVGVSSSAYAALQLTKTGPDGPENIPNNAYWFDMASNPSVADIVTALNSITPGLGLTEATITPVLLKNDQANPPAANVGALAGSYVVSYDPLSDPDSATIAYVAGQPFFDTSKLTWLLAKDGDKGGHYLWNLTGLWNGTDTINIEGLYAGQGAFSHVSIGGVAVPEPTTVIAGVLLLLPFGLSTLRMVRRNRAA